MTSPDPFALARIVRALAELAAMESVNEHAIVYGAREGRSTEPDALTPTEAASAHGTLTRGRRVHAVVCLLPADVQDVATWVGQRAETLAHGPLDVRALALHYALDRGPG